MKTTIRTYTPDEIGKLSLFFSAYLNAYPDAKLMSPEFYTHHPVLRNGENAFCALDAAENVVGFAPLLPAPVADESLPENLHHIWAIIIAAPELQDGDRVRELLFNRVLERAVAIKQSLTGRAVRLAADYMASQRPDIDFLMARGFTDFDRIYVMQCDLASSLPRLDPPTGITVERRKMTSVDEQRRYLDALNRCFPENPKNLDALRFLLRSPLWNTGTAITAFDQRHQVVGSVLAYWEDANPWGITDDVFVLPEWRRRGIARFLVNEGLRYFWANGLAAARLEVKRGNAPAVALYRATGHTIINEEVLLGRYI
jgi:GNAT superfamily N-acetyltransferase